MGILVHLGPLAAALIIPSVLVSGWLSDAEASLLGQTEPKKVATATLAEAGYCTADLKQIVRRVAGACGLLGAEGRGCQPADASKVVKLEGSDFNALFMPLKDRVRIIQFDMGKAELDEGAKLAVEQTWAERGGASFFFVVSRASPEGAKEKNLELSEARAKAVLAHLEERYKDPDIKRQVGLLSLGEEYAQLGVDFCEWKRSRTGEKCDDKDINRSAFIAWIDCAI
jgi:outer membrane protein OmpA-like peptidoglycan-associated protein